MTINKEYIDKLKEKRDKEHMSYRMLSRLIETETGERIPHSTLNDWLNGGWEKRKNNESKDKFITDKENLLTKEEIKKWKNLYYSNVKTVALQDLLTKTLENSVKTISPLPLLPVQIGKKYGSLHRAGLLISDFHYGEVVDYEQTGGLGHYSPEIASKRLHLLTKKVIELTEIRRNGLSIPDIDIMLMGDIVSGNIHEELAETNAVNILDQTTESAYLLAQSVGMIAQHFNHVRVFGVPGNHGRMTKKPTFKDRYVSWDYICYQLMSLFLKEHKNIEFNLTKSFFQPVEMLNTKVLILHGDGIRGSLGIPFYGIERAVQRLRQILDLKHERFDKIILAHFHDPVDSERYIVNGAIKSQDEYAITNLFGANNPSQTLFYVNENHGIVSTEKIYLQDADEDKTLGLNRGIESVWARNVI